MSLVTELTCTYLFSFCVLTYITYRSQWPTGLRRGSEAARLLELHVRSPPEEWMSVSCECYVLSSRGLCDEPITRPEKPYELLCAILTDLEISKHGGLGPR